MIYIACFLISIIFTYCAQKMNEKNSVILTIFLSIIAILTVAILAGLRDGTIGTDLGNYGDKYFQYALSSANINQFFQIYHDEFFYGLLNFIVSRAFNDVHWLYFFVALIQITFVYVGIYNYRKNIPMWLGQTLYLLFFYNMSLNVLRQSIAMSIVFYASKYITTQKPIKFLVSILIAAQFHSSAYLAIVLYVIYPLVTGRNKISIKLSVIFVLLFVLININNIANLCINIGVLPAKYVWYSSGEFNQQNGFSNSGFSIKNIDFILNAGILIVYSIFYKLIINNGYNKKLNQYLYVIIIFSLILTQASTFSFAFAARIGLYFSYFLIVALPQLIVAINSKSKIFVYSGILVYCLVYWYVRVVVFGYDETWPYTSHILGFY